MDSFRKSRNNRRGRNIEKRNYITDQSRYEGKCFESGNYGHIDNECPEAKKNYARWSKNKKALGDKSDDDNIENEHEEIVGDMLWSWPCTVAERGNMIVWSLTLSCI